MIDNNKKWLNKNSLRILTRRFANKILQLQTFISYKTITARLELLRKLAV